MLIICIEIVLGSLLGWWLGRVQFRSRTRLMQKMREMMELRMYNEVLKERINVHAYLSQYLRSVEIPSHCTAGVFFALTVLEDRLQRLYAAEQAKDKGTAHGHQNVHHD